jgi:hypothetical protein
MRSGPVAWVQEERTMDFLQGIPQGCPVAIWWLSALFTPYLLALLPLSSPQKSGRS